MPPADAIAELVASLLRSEPVRTALAEVLAEVTPSQTIAPAVLTSDELCEALRISRSKLDGLVGAGLPYLRVGSTRRYQLSAVLEWLREQDEQEAA